MRHRASTERISEHARLEIAHAVHAGHRPGEPPPLAADDPVPGCSCPRCVTVARGGTPEEAARVEAVVRDLARIDPADRLRAAGRTLNGADDLDVPSAGWLCRRAAELPRAVEPDQPERDDDDPLPVEEARGASIVDVARRLGLGDPEPRGRERVVTCPFHDDRDPSLRLEPDRGLWHCFPCSLGGDTIDLVTAVRDVSFPEAVKWVAGGGGR